MGIDIGGGMLVGACGALLEIPQELEGEYDFDVY